MHGNGKLKDDSLTPEQIHAEKERVKSAAELLPNRWIIAVGAGLFLGLKSTGFGFEMTPIKFYQLFMETVKYVCLALVVVSVWMTMFRFFVGRFKGELTWFAILMVFLFSTETFANLFINLGKYVTTYSAQATQVVSPNENDMQMIEQLKRKKDAEQ